MKQFWIGLTVLLVLLLGSLGVAAAMDSVHSGIARDLDRAAQAARQEDWDRAMELAAGAGEKWKQCWRMSAAAADHEPLEEADGLFAELYAYGRSRETAQFTAACGSLARQVRAMAEAHGLTWWNIL